MFSSKKGNVVDILVVSLVLMVAAVWIISLQAVNIQLTNALNDSDLGLNVTPMQKTQTAINIFDMGIVGLYVAAILFSVISAYYIGSHPFFFIFSVILMLVFNVVLAIEANTFNAMITSDFLGTTANSFPYTVYLIRYLPFECLIAFGLIVIALYAGKTNNGGSSM